MAERLSEELRKQLRDLALLPDSEINTSDIPVESDWGDALRGIWNPVDYARRHYDIRGVANEILARLWSRGVRPSNMALNKLTWFIYEKALTKLGILLSDARVEAWDHGPVFREIYSPAKEYGSKPIASLLEGFSRDERRMISVKADIDEQTSALIDDVLNEVGDLSASALRDLSHESEGPWDLVWNSNRSTSAGMVISPHLILASASARAHKNER